VIPCLLCVVAQNGQVDDVKNMMVSPGAGIDLEFDSDGKYYSGSGCLLLCLLYFHILSEIVDHIRMTCLKITNCCTSTFQCLQCFDTVGWVAGRASGL